MAQGVQINFGGDASDAQRAMQAFERTLAAMTKTAEQQATALGKVNTKLDELGEKREPPKQVSIFGEALAGVGEKLTALVGTGALLAAFTRGMQEAGQAAQEAGNRVKEFETAAQLAARVAAATGESRQQIVERGQRIAEQEGLSPAEAIRISALASQEGFGSEAQVFARARARLGINAEQAIDVAGKLRDTLGADVTAGRFFGAVQSAANTISANPDDIIANLETLGPQGARAGLSLEETVALITGLGERTGKKQAIGAARSLLDLQVGGIDRERPATAADIAAAVAAGQAPSRTVKEKVRFGSGLSGIAALVRSPEFRTAALQDANLALAGETFADIEGDPPGITARARAGVEFPEAALPTQQAVRGLEARTANRTVDLGQLANELQAARSELSALRAQVLEAQGNGFLGAVRQARFAAESATIDLLRAPFGPSSQLAGIRAESADLLRLLGRIEENTRSGAERERKASPELSTPDGPANYNGRAAFGGGGVEG